MARHARRTTSRQSLVGLVEIDRSKGTGPIESEVTMRFWIRELAGWLLIGLGLYVFFACYVILVNQGPHLIEAGPLTFIGFIIFRGGIHLLKVATAARICLHAQSEILRRQNPAPSPIKEGAKREKAPLDW